MDNSRHTNAFDYTAMKTQHVLWCSPGQEKIKIKKHSKSLNLENLSNIVKEKYKNYQTETLWQMVN